MRLSSTPDGTLITIVSLDANQNIEYVGCAASGSPTSDSVWAIMRIIYDANNNFSRTAFAEKNRVFNKIWDDRASYSYS